MTEKEDQRLLPQTAKLPDLKALKSLPDLEREAALDTMARRINDAHGEIEKFAKAVMEVGNEAIKRAIACGEWLRTVKAALKHGEFEDWCALHLKFKMRKAQYYMLLAQRHAAKDILSLKPQSLRQALIYAGALPEDSEKGHRPGKFDELARFRQTVRRLLQELRANEDYHADVLLRETEPIIKWRTELAAKLSSLEKPVAVVDVVAELGGGADHDVEQDDSPKTQHDALLRSGEHELSRDDTSDPLGPDARARQKAAALADFDRREPLRAIANRYRVSASTIVRWVKSAGKPPRTTWSSNMACRQENERRKAMRKAIGVKRA